jgi:hypothetical protein
VNPRPFLILLAFVIGCTDEVRVFISDPPRGSQIASEDPIVFAVDAQADEVLITNEGSSISLAVPGLLLLPAVRGMGFASAGIAGDPLIAVRAWQQGTFHPAHAALPDSVSIQLGNDILTGGPGSASSIVEAMLRGQNLKPFITHNRTVELDFLVGDVEVVIVPKVVVSKDITIKLVADDSRLTLTADLRDIDIEYQAEGGPFTAPGTAVIDHMRLTSEVSLQGAAAFLVEPHLTITEPRITDGGRLPSQAAQLLVPMFRREISIAFRSAAALATNAALRQLLEGLRPQLAINFDKPILQETDLGVVAVEGRSIRLRYNTRAVPVDALLTAERGFLRGAYGHPPDGKSATALVGPPILNLLAHAAWSAGNFEKVKFSRTELHELGLPSLGFPYNQLRSITLSMLLPPVFEWSENRARVDVGELEVEFDIRHADDVRGYTALRIPVDMCQHGRDLRLCSDGTREIEVLEVEFNKLHDFASRKKIVSLMQSAARGVVKHMLQTLPGVKLPALTFRDFDGKAVVTLEPTVTAVHTVADGWLLDLAFREIE